MRIPIISLSLILLIVCSSFSHASEALDSMQINSNNLSIAANLQKNDSNQTNPAIDSSQIKLNLDSNKLSLGERLSAEEFMYANSPRYTITGDLPYRNTELSPLTISLVSGSMAAFFVAQHIYQSNTIWKDKASFKIQEDGQYALYADKAGHFYGAYLSGYVLTEAMVQSGFSWQTSYLGGGLLGFAYSTYVEILDGYGANWGFSPSDFYADAAGAALYIGQYYAPVLQNFTPKWTYVPPRWHGYHNREPHDIFIDNYSAHTMWLSINVHNLLPNSIHNYWPEWLELSVGYAARNLALPQYLKDPNTGEVIKDPNTGKALLDDKAFPDSERFNDIVWGNPKFIIALDYNLKKIVPSSYPFVNWLIQTLNTFKFPAPAVEFGTKGAKFFLLYPFG